MNMFVVCCNDYPDSVFFDEQEAENYKDFKNREAEDNQERYAMRQYWRVREVPLKGRVKPC